MTDKTAPATRWVTLVANGSAVGDITVDIASKGGRSWPIRGIAITVTGAVELTDENDNDIYFSNLPVGIYPLAPKEITANTTATIVGLYGP